MKITLEQDGATCTLEDPEVVNLCDTLMLCEQALRGLGFVFEGELSVISREDLDYDSVSEA